MSASLHLLQPYYSALISMGVDEGLVHVDGDGVQHSREIQAGRDQRVRDDLLQLLTLYDRASIAWTEGAEAEEYKPTPMMHMHGRGLQTAGVAELLRDHDLEQIYTPKQASTFGDVWKPYAAAIAALAPLISGQLAARGKPVSELLINFALAVRLGDYDQARLLSHALPEEDKAPVRAIQQETKEAIRRYDMPILSEAHQCVFAIKRAREHENTVVGPALQQQPIHSPIQKDLPGAARRVIAVITEVLLQQDLELPLPRTLSEAIELRTRPAMAEFRQVFFPWLSRLLGSDSSEEQRLRREVVGMLRARHWLPRVRRLAKFVHYVGIAGEVAGLAALGLPGLGLVVTVVSGGTEKLAERLESKSRWLLCTSAAATHDQ